MVIERIKAVTALRASKLTGIDRTVIAKAMDLYSASGGKLGLAFFIEDGKKNRKIRLCAIDDWLTGMERMSAYAR